MTGESINNSRGLSGRWAGEGVGKNSVTWIHVQRKHVYMKKKFVVHIYINHFFEKNCNEVLH